MSLLQKINELVRADFGQLVNQTQQLSRSFKEATTQAQQLNQVAQEMGPGFKVSADESAIVYDKNVALAVQSARNEAEKSQALYAKYNQALLENSKDTYQKLLDGFKELQGELAGQGTPEAENLSSQIKTMTDNINRVLSGKASAADYVADPAQTAIEQKIADAYANARKDGVFDQTELDALKTLSDELKAWREGYTFQTPVKTYEIKLSTGEKIQTTVDPASFIEALESAARRS